MNEKILNELKEVRELLKVVSVNKDYNDNRIIQMLSVIEYRIYTIEEDVKWIKNGGKHLGDARGQAGIAGS